MDSDAQRALSSTVRCYPSSKYKILPKLFDLLGDAFDKVAILQETAEGKKSAEIARHHNTIKGGMYIVTVQTFLLVCLRDWKMFNRFIICMGRAQVVDKQSIQALVRRQFLDCCMLFSHAEFEIPFSSQLANHLDQFAKCVGIPLEKPKADVDTNVANRAGKRRKAHDAVFTELLNHLKAAKDGQWRFQMMAGHIFGMISREDAHVRKDVIEYLLEKSCSEVLPLRQSSWLTLGRFLYIMKRRSVAQTPQDKMYKRILENHNLPVAEYLQKLTVHEIPEQEWNDRYDWNEQLSPFTIP